MQAGILRLCDRLLTLLHARGLHAAVLAGVVMMPLVVVAGFLTVTLDPSGPHDISVPPLRGSLDPRPPKPAADHRAAETGSRSAAFTAKTQRRMAACGQDEHCED